MICGLDTLESEKAIGMWLKTASFTCTLDTKTALSKIKLDQIIKLNY